MTERLADVSARLSSVHQLNVVVTAMQQIAAARAQQSRGLLAGVEAYSGRVALAIGEALRLLPVDGAPPGAGRRGAAGLILFGAEQGFVGPFNDRLLDAVGQDLRLATLLIVGTRATALAEERGLQPDWSAAMASQIGAVPETADLVADALYDRIESVGLTHVDMIYSRPATGGNVTVERRSLLPLDLDSFRAALVGAPPLVTLPPQRLLERLAREYVYAQLCAAAMHAFAAENEARMTAMAAARDNIEDTIERLSASERMVRQEEITAEIIELAAGAEALSSVRR